MLRAYNAYAKFIDILCKVLDYICIILMLAMVGVVFYQVIMRQIFDNAPAWSEEVALIMKAWFVYLGIAIGLKENLHIGIGMIVDRLPRKVAFVVELIVSGLILVLSVLFYHFGSALANFVRANTLPATGTSVSVFYFAIVTSGLLMILIVLLRIAGQIVNRKEFLNNEH